MVSRIVGTEFHVVSNTALRSGSSDACTHLLDFLNYEQGQTGGWQLRVTSQPRGLKQLGFAAKARDVTETESLGTIWE